mmetsp:Transcript_42998/g.51612  ORF Transcript_42998/g.51612 Transcript_42998/m.51612 type:complete len:1157 (-) Transcript_42998:110-3580(-)
MRLSPSCLPRNDTTHLNTKKKHLNEESWDAVLSAVKQEVEEVDKIIPKGSDGKRNLGVIVKENDTMMRQGLLEKISSANADICLFYNNKAWDHVAIESTKTNDSLAKMKVFAKDVSSNEHEPRCKISTETDNVDELLVLAANNGERLHTVLRDITYKSNGAYHRGPSKKKYRILEKANSKYNGDASYVVDVERASAVYNSLDDFDSALLLLKKLVDQKDIVIPKCKDRFNTPYKYSGYRDMLLNVNVDGFVGELQLHFKRIYDLKDLLHPVYEIERTLAGENLESIHPGLKSEQVLSFQSEENDTDTPIDALVLKKAVDDLLPNGICVANVYLDNNGTTANVYLSIEKLNAMFKLRDHVLSICTNSDFSTQLNNLLEIEKHLKVKLDLGAFAHYCAMVMMRFTELTPHQLKQLENIRGRKVALLLAPAGGGKTFVAIQRMLGVIAFGKSVVFCARNIPLALFVINWLIHASRKSAEIIVKQIFVLVEPFSSGPKNISITNDNGHQLINISDKGAYVDHEMMFDLFVIDEAHHIIGDEHLRSQLQNFSGVATKFLFLGDTSQSHQLKTNLNKENISSILHLQNNEEVVVAKLTEVVRSTKRVVAGASAFQLVDGSKAATETHCASIGLPLDARIFVNEKDAILVDTYAREVVVALKNVSLQLGHMSLHDRVAIICPDGKFVKEFEVPLKTELARQFSDSNYELVSATRASASLMCEHNSATTKKEATNWLVLDSIEMMDGLERLVVICVDLDNVILSSTKDATRCKLYRAMTRSQLAVAIVNQEVRGGWLEFLGHLRFNQSNNFDDKNVKKQTNLTAADDILSGTVNKIDVDDEDEALVIKADDDDLSDTSDDSIINTQVEQGIFSPTLVPQFITSSSYIPKFMPLSSYNEEGFSKHDKVLIQKLHMLDDKVNSLVPKAANGEFVKISNLNNPELHKEAAKLAIECVKISRMLHENAWNSYLSEDGVLSQEEKGKLKETKRSIEAFEVPFFSDKLKQRTNDVDELYRVAKEKYSIVRTIFKDIATKTGGDFIMPPLKSRSRTEEKINFKYPGDASYIRDILRGSLVYSSPTNLLSGLQEVKGKTELRILNLENKFLHPDAFGYRGLDFNVDIDGFIFEIQLHSKRILAIKEYLRPTWDIIHYGMGWSNDEIETYLAA